MNDYRSLMFIVIACVVAVCVMEIIGEISRDEPTQVEYACPDPEIGQLGKHEYVTVMGSAYKVNRLPGGSYEIIGKLGRYVEVD